MLFSLLQGDIVSIEVDAIVNAASTCLLMGGGVAKAIMEKGGKEIEVEAVKKAPIDLGNAIATTAGSLSAKFVIHGATMHLGGLASAKAIKNSVKNSLKLADSLNLKSIAFPAMGCGIGGYPKRSGAKIILKEIYSFNPKNLEKAVVVLYSKRDFEIFAEIAKKDFMVKV